MERYEEDDFSGEKAQSKKMKNDEKVERGY
jgi:hypothetical protein